MKWESILVYSPRVLAIIYILFLGLFALDAFEPHRSLLENIQGFLIHLIPNYLLIFMLLIAWRYKKFGGTFFLLLALSFILLFDNSLIVNILLFGPLAIIGCLFLLSDYLLREKEANL